MIRCENNRTEAFLNVDGVYGYRGVTRARWEGMSQATRIGAGDSTTGQAAFLNNAIGFVSRLVAEGSVILEVEGYNVRGGAARYSLSPKLVDGLYALAATCEWDGKLAAREKDAGSERDDDLRYRDQIKEMLPIIETMGKEKFLKLLDEVLP